MLVGGGGRVAGEGGSTGAGVKDRNDELDPVFVSTFSLVVFERFFYQVHGSRGEREGACSREPIRGYLDAGGDVRESAFDLGPASARTSAKLTLGKVWRAPAPCRPTDFKFTTLLTENIKN